MKTKRLLTVLLTVALAVILLAVGASAETIVASGTVGELSWMLEDDGTLYIDGSGDMPDFALDDNGKSTAPWLQSGTPVKRIRFIGMVPYIGDYAFAGDADLKSVVLSNADTIIGDYVFYNCTELTDFSGYEDGTNVTHYGDYAFAGCTSLRSLNLGNPTNIGTRTFYNCKELYNVYLPASLTEWGVGSFEGAGLGWVETEMGLTALGEDAFLNCEQLEGIAIASSVTDFGGESGNVFNGCPNLTIKAHADTPAAKYATTKGIPFEEADHNADAEYHCSYCGILTGKTGNLKWSIDTDGNMRLYGEGSINDQEITWKNYKDQIRTLTVEKGVTGKTWGFNWCENLVSVSLPEGITKVDDFSSCSSLTTINIPSTVTEIGDSALSDCTSLKTVKLPKSVTTLGNSAFESCSAMKNITLPEGITSIGSWCFASCENLETIELPASLQSIGPNAFYGCAKLDGIWVNPKSQYYTSDDKGVLYTKDMTELAIAPPSLSGVYTIPQTVTSIQDSAFRSNGKLTEVILSEQLTRIEFQAFSQCTALKTITFPEGLRFIDSSAFSGCTSLKTIYFTGPAPEIYPAFWDVTATVYYPAGDETWTEEFRNGSYGGTLTWVAYDLDQSLKIVEEPKNTYTQAGKTVKVPLKAQGKGLKYQWYIKNAGQKKYSKSAVTSATYSCKMNEKAKDRLAYCIITDAEGNRIKSKTVILREAASITSQPKNTQAQSGNTVKVTVKASGDGLKYQWYVKNAGAKKFTKSSVTKATYSTKMREAAQGRQIYCVVTDTYGKTAKSKTVTLGMTVSITQQPKSVTVKEGQTAKVSFQAVGDGLTYTWYFSDVDDATFKKTSTFTGNTYSVKMGDSRNGRLIYCVVADAYGNKVATDIVSLKMK